MAGRDEINSLVCKLQKGDEDSAEQLYKIFKDEIYPYILEQVDHDQRLAEDLLQDTVVEIVKAIIERKNPDDILEWGRQIARQICTAYLENRKKLHPDEDMNQIMIMLDLGSNSTDIIPDILQNTKDPNGTVLHLLNELPEDQKRAMALHYINEMSAEEIAALQGISAVKVKSRLSQGRKTLERLLDSSATEEKPTLEISKVHFSAVAPQKLVKGEYSLIDILMYEESARQIVDEVISEAQDPVKETKSGLLNVQNNAEIRIVLTSPDFEIEDNEETAIWCGEYLHFSFAVSLPDTFTKRQVLFQATVYINGLIGTRLKFIAQCTSQREQKLDISREDILSAFVSYASQDRRRVATLIQGMKKARPDMDIFFDVESLRSGEDWERALTAEIERRDVLFLCWSTFARESKWVDTEWRYALQCKGAEAIEPIPIDPPDVCPPPEELQKKHFNDKMLYIINSNLPPER